MKALTIWQPWASLIIAGAKPYEFRGWRAPRSIIGQRIVIHAAARKMNLLETLDLFRVLTMRDRSDDHRVDAAETCLVPEKALPILGMAIGGELPMACGLGTAIVGEPRPGPEIAEEFSVPRANDSDRDEHANWGWPMLDIEVWDASVPMRGAQGFWHWPTPEELSLTTEAVDA
ncbi:MAG: ASCH domain-containing protein [Methylovirgula sp.]|nr:ASCH domain-containing protein [Methylovirgula sp.]